MSEKKTVAAKQPPKKDNAKQPTFLTKVGKGFTGFFKRIGNAFKKMWHELKKVTWPTKDKLINYSCIVVLFMVGMMIVIGLLDTGSSTLVNWIMSLRA